MVAEDEEGCAEEYKQKGLIEKSANFECDSPIYNSDSAAILSVVYNWTIRKSYRRERYQPNIPVLVKGVTVQIQATKCNSISECWKGADEDCGFSTAQTFIIGNISFLNFMSSK